MTSYDVFLNPTQLNFSFSKTPILLTLEREDGIHMNN